VKGPKSAVCMTKTMVQRVGSEPFSVRKTCRAWLWYKV
jgi:hypothetical protein